MHILKFIKKKGGNYFPRAEEKKGTIKSPYFFEKVLDRYSDYTI